MSNKSVLGEWYQWQIQGNEARKAEKKFFGDQDPPYLRVSMTAPPPLPPLSEGLDLPLCSTIYRRYSTYLRK